MQESFLSEVLAAQISDLLTLPFLNCIWLKLCDF